MTLKVLGLTLGLASLAPTPGWCARSVSTTERLPAALPKTLNDLSVYARKDVHLSRSDIQGPLMAGGRIRIQDFGVREQPALRAPEHAGISTSVIAGGDFEGHRFWVAAGGIEAGGGATLSQCRVDGPVLAEDHLRGSNCRLGWKSGVRSNRAREAVQKIDQELTEFTAKVDRLYAKFAGIVTRSSRVVASSKLNLVEFDRLPGTLVIDTQGDASRIVVIRVVTPQPVSVHGLTVFLESGARPEQLVFSFPNTEQITMTRSGSRSDQGELGFPGMLLAPQATLSASSMLITGSVFVENFFGANPTEPAAQVNAAVFRGLPGVPAETPPSSD